MLEKERLMREEFDGKYMTLERTVKQEIDARMAYETEIRRLLDERWRNYSVELEEIKQFQAEEKAKNKDRFAKINEALAVLEKHLEASNKKIARVVGSEAQARKLHEKGLLSKLTDIEDRLAAYLSGMNQAIDDAGHGRNGKIPNLDFDGVSKRRIPAHSHPRRFAKKWT